MEKYSGVVDLARIVPGVLDLPVTLPLRELIALVERGSGVPRILSTAQAAKVLGYSTKTWLRRCKEGQLPGAFRDERDRWRIPREDAERFIAQQHNRNGGIRGPRKRGPSAPPQTR